MPHFKLAQQLLRTIARGSLRMQGNYGTVHAAMRAQTAGQS
jgi:hypothetical protein